MARNRVDRQKLTPASTFRFSPGLAAALGACLLLSACSGKQPSVSDQQDEQGSEVRALFSLVPPAQSGIDFVNSVQEGPQINYFNYGYIYNGGGVAVGDVDGDGLADLYFSATMGSNRLYRNLGDFRFEDITEQAGVAAAQGFKTGVVMVDINSDGLLDIYVCRTGNGPLPERSNLLFVNQGGGVFEEQAGRYGLDLPSNTNQAVFFDYDRDGDLDCYLLNHPIRFGTNTRPRLKGGVRYTQPDTPEESDRLLRNDGGVFRDVSEQAGVINSAFGLSVMVSDYNGDGLPDLFVANDYIEPDFLFINRGNGTFSEQSAAWFDLMSQNSMGSDAADLNADGMMDLLVLDMLPETHQRQKALMSTMMLDRYQTLLDYGYGKQQMRNVLQLSGGGAGFREAAHQAGIYATDWSWAPLMADFDNDGLRDVFISNGYRRDVTDLDFIRYKNDSLRRDMPISELHRVLERIPSVKLTNYLYLQQADGSFRQASAAQGLRQAAFSNGAVYADLNNDGFLDLVVNNLEDPAAVYRNNANREGHWLRVRLAGGPGNTQAIGAQVEVQAGGKQFVAEQQPVRGYFSSVDPVLHFGLGPAEQIEKIRVRWSDGTWSEGWAGPASREVLIRYGEEPAPAPTRPEPQPLMAASDRIRFAHRENPFEDFKREFLLPRRLSREGPGMCAADLNGDGLEDLFIGGAAGQPAAIYWQESAGRFRMQVPEAFRADAAHEDTRSVALDANGDGHTDLYVCSGGYAEPAGSVRYQDRLYLGDGRGGFSRDNQALPSMPQPSSSVVVLDLDADGQPDLFVGGRAVPGRYPEAPRSYLLRNQGGRFLDETEARAPELMNPGMVTDALWLPGEAAGLGRLMLCGEWMPLQHFELRDGRFGSATVLPNSSGWWNCLYAGDWNGDGQTDVLAGNLGRNSRFRPSPDAPLLLLAKDFDNNGSIDPVVFQSLEGAMKPVPAFDLLSAQLPHLRRRFNRYQHFARANLDELFTPAEQQGARRLEVQTLDSWVLHADGSGGYRSAALPPEAQSFPVQAALSADWNADGLSDLLLAGNFYHLDVESGPITAGRGLMLLAKAGGGWQVVDASASGFSAPGDVRSLVALALPNLSTGPASLLVVGRNDGETLSFILRAPNPPTP